MSGTHGAGVASIDLNADVGEVADPAVDLALLGVISSANIACGGHAGDARSMMRLCTDAVDRGVAIGAQVSYPDREGFGRRLIAISRRDLHDALARQFEDLAAAADATGGQVTYLKPHGALYHAAIDDPVTAEVIVDLAVTHAVSVLTMGFGQLRSQAMSAGVPVFGEAFLDRGYTAEGRLAPRGDAGALLDADAAIARLQTWIPRSFDGAHSLCVHSDSPDAIVVAERSRTLLERHRITVAAFTHRSESAE